MSKSDEIVIVAPRKAIFDNERLTFQGVETDKDKCNEILANIQKSFISMRRGSSKELHTPLDKNAELNTEFKQLIPYAVIRRGDELFTYERLEGGGESRLHGTLSLGAGGHMNSVAGVSNFMEVVMTNLERELDEELDFSSDEKITHVIGFINDDLHETGKVHLGVLLIIDIPETVEVTVREVDELDGDFVPIVSLKSKTIYNRLESWSQIVIDTLEV